MGPTLRIDGEEAPPIWEFVRGLLRKNGVPDCIVPTEMSILLSTGQRLVVPLFPTSPENSDDPAPVRLTRLQRKILAVLREATESIKGAVLAHECGLEHRSSLYRPGGLMPLVRAGMVAKIDGGYLLEWDPEEAA
jgi:hypothetical protein